ncbi:MAG: LysM peptidoglycan-binding domain-containing protein, partial [Acidobacteriota bacterium]|nr:LysM peptidoglycan-binding domain-containing protein [Acidobacteriota bacterium]
MRQRVALAALLLAGVLAISGATWAEEAHSSVHPPKNLKLVGDHWTAWDSPEPGPDDYIIQKGDTLWDLAGKWLDDPFLWPQVWDENRYILDSHWIYPGDPLVVPGRPTVVPPEGKLPVTETTSPPGTAEITEVPGQEGDTGEVGVTEVTQPAPLVAVADPGELWCSGFITPSHEDSTVQIADAEQRREYLGQGAVIYMNQGRNQGVEAGSEWAIVRPTRSVAHPGTKRTLGQYVRRMGRARVMVTQENTSTAVISMACGDIVRGDQLLPWADIPLPLLSSMPVFDRWDVTPSGETQGHIVAFKD